MSEAESVKVVFVQIFKSRIFYLFIAKMFKRKVSPLLLMQGAKSGPISSPFYKLLKYDIHR